eukprot:COSAG04_NODE_3179_length_3085_cov_6.045546_2_plen_461_part_00
MIELILATRDRDAVQRDAELHCTPAIVFGWVLGAAAFLTLLAGAFCKTGMVKGPCEQEHPGALIIVAGLHMCIPASWVLMGNYRQDLRAQLVSRDNKLLTGGSFAMVYAILAGSVGIACRKDALVGISDCRATGFWLCAGAYALLNPATLTVLGWAVKRNHRRQWFEVNPEAQRQDYKNSDGALTQWKSCAMAGGPFFFIEGLILSIFGGLCIEDVIPGVDDCMGEWEELPTGIASGMGWALNWVGALLFIPGLFWTGFTFLDGAKSTSFVVGYWLCVAGFVPMGIGLACIDDNLYGQDCSRAVDITWAVKATMLGTVFACAGISTLVWWREPVRLRLHQIYKSPPVVAGSVQLTVGALITYYGWACADGLLDECRPTGVVLLCVGPSLILLGLYCTLICYFWQPNTAPRGGVTGQDRDTSAHSSAGRGMDSHHTSFCWQVSHMLLRRGQRWRGGNGQRQ